MFPTTLAGSLPKPGWLAETNKLWPDWKQQGEALRQAKADATLLWLKLQEDAGLDVVTDGEQSRQHFVHGFLEQVEGIDFVEHGESAYDLGTSGARRSVLGTGSTTATEVSA